MAWKVYGMLQVGMGVHGGGMSMACMHVFLNFLHQDVYRTSAPEQDWYEPELAVVAAGVAGAA